MLNELFSQLIGGDTLSQISGVLGTDEGTAQNAMQTALPVLVGAAARHASTPEGAGNLMGMLDQNQDGNVLDDLAGFLGRPQAASGMGHGLLDMLFGGQRSQEEGNAEDTRNEILAKSLSLFNTRGYTAVSIDDIAAAAGITKPTFYYHFPSKAEVFIESILWLLAQVRAFIEHIAGQTELTVYERLTGMIQGRRARLTREPIIVFNESRMEEAKMHLTTEQNGRIHKAVQSFHQPLSRMLAEGIASGELRADADPEILAVLLRQMLQPTTYHSLPEKDPVTVDAAVLELFYRGAARRNSEPGPS